MALIIITYLAGILTILSPCILPVIPFVFAKSEQSFAKGTLPLLAGMALTFSAFSALAIIGVKWIVHVNGVGRTIALIFLCLVGLSLLFPKLSDWLFTPLARLGGKIGSPQKDLSATGSFVIGVSTGLLWAPCAGPILALVLSGAASQTSVVRSVMLLLSYSAGAATSLAVLLLAGKKVIATLKKHLGLEVAIRRVLGAAVLGGVILVGFHLDQKLLPHLPGIDTISLESRLLKSSGVLVKQTQPVISPLPTAEAEPMEGAIPRLNGAIGWINSKPLNRNELRGKVVLIDFWTYSCINCLRTLPFVKAWAKKYRKNGLVVIGVHTPEFAFEKNLNNVRKAVKRLGITYPVAVDSDYKIWNAFQNEYWPAEYIVDRNGQIRHHHFGEGHYAETEKILRQLLAEKKNSANLAVDHIQANGIEAPAQPLDDESPETYIGTNRAQNFVGLPQLRTSQTVSYKAPSHFELNEWSLAGLWHVTGEKAELRRAHGKIFFRFHARDLHLVMGASHPVKFKVTIDGRPPGLNHGVDTNASGEGVVRGPRLYQLIRQRGKQPISSHTFEIEFFTPGVDAFSFTFG